MPQLGIEANSAASANGVPRAATSEGIMKATPLMNRKELDVTPTEMSVIDQRAPVPSWPVVFGSLAIRPCFHTRDSGYLNLVSGGCPGRVGPNRRQAGWDCLAPHRAVSARIVARLGSTECALVESPARTVSPS